MLLKVFKQSDVCVSIDLRCERWQLHSETQSMSKHPYIGRSNGRLLKGGIDCTDFKAEDCLGVRQRVGVQRRVVNRHLDEGQRADETAGHLAPYIPPFLRA